MNQFVLFEFNVSSELSNWQVINDGVMGGNSESTIFLNAEGHGTFEGKISLENNGGFCSIKHDFDPVILDKNKFICIRLKGDGKEYQFRVKSCSTDSHSYVFPFQTNRDWQTIEIPITALYPTFRGRELNMPRYDGSNLEEIAFLIGNKKGENFQLFIDTIEVK